MKVSKLPTEPPGRGDTKNSLLDTVGVQTENDLAGNL